MQIANYFDEVSIEKTIKGFKISAVAALLAGFVMLVPEINEFIQKGDPINWGNVLIAAWGSLSGGIINAGKQWLAGEQKA